MSEWLGFVLLVFGVPLLTAIGFAVWGLVLALAEVDRWVNPYWRVER